MRHRRVCSAPRRRATAALALGALAFALALGGCGGSSGSSTGGGTAPVATAAGGTTTATGPGGAATAQADSGAETTGEASDESSSATRGNETGAAAPPGATEADATAAPKVEHGACGPQLGEFIADMEGLRRNLVVGVSYEQYVSELGVLRKIYDRIPVDTMDLDCLSGAAASAEQSFDGYLAAANVWGDCVSDSECETAEVEPRLQHKWHLAAQQLKRAQAAAG